jgi:sodium/bile acid cotransporter 7
MLLMLGAVCAEDVLDDEAKKHRVAEMYEQYKKSFPEVADLSPEQVFKIMKRVEVVFVDVRSSEEQSVSMIPGAITHERFLEHPDPYEEHTVIGYCTISYRSGKLASKLRKRGIRMINMRGGLLAWLHAGGLVHRDGIPVRKVHVYGRKWDLAPSSYETIY